MKKALFYLTLILRPSYWLMNEEFNESWDRKLSQLIDSEKVTILGDYHMKIGDYTLWYRSHPFASFTLKPERKELLEYEYRPSRYTIHRLGKIVQDERIRLMSIQIKKGTS